MSSFDQTGYNFNISQHIVVLAYNANLKWWAMCIHSTNVRLWILFGIFSPQCCRFLFFVCRDVSDWLFWFSATCWALRSTNPSVRLWVFVFFKSSSSDRVHIYRSCLSFLSGATRCPEDLCFWFFVCKHTLAAVFVRVLGSPVEVEF